MNNSQPLIRVSGLEVALPDMSRKPLFGKAPPIRILDGLDFDIAKGSVLGIVGQSGSGKSTLGRTLLRLIEPTGGTMTFEGRDIAHVGEAGLRQFRRQAQMIFQDPMSSLNPRHRVGTIIAGPLRLNGFDRVGERTGEALDHVGLPRSFVSR